MGTWSCLKRKALGGDIMPKWVPPVIECWQLVLLAHYLWSDKFPQIGARHEVNRPAFVVSPIAADFCTVRSACVCLCIAFIDTIVVWRPCSSANVGTIAHWGSAEAAYSLYMFMCAYSVPFIFRPLYMKAPPPRRQKPPQQLRRRRKRRPPKSRRKRRR